VYFGTGQAGRQGLATHEVEPGGMWLATAQGEGAHPLLPGMEGHGCRTDAVVSHGVPPGEPKQSVMAYVWVDRRRYPTLPAFVSGYLDGALRDWKLPGGCPAAATAAETPPPHHAVTTTTTPATPLPAYAPPPSPTSTAVVTPPPPPPQPPTTAATTSAPRDPQPATTAFFAALTPERAQAVTAALKAVVDTLYRSDTASPPPRQLLATRSRRNSRDPAQLLPTREEMWETVVTAAGSAGPPADRVAEEDAAVIAGCEGSLVGGAGQHLDVLDFLIAAWEAAVAARAEPSLASAAITLGAMAARAGAREMEQHTKARAMQQERLQASSAAASVDMREGVRAAEQLLTGTALVQQALDALPPEDAAALRAAKEALPAAGGAQSLFDAAGEGLPQLKQRLASFWNTYSGHMVSHTLCGLRLVLPLPPLVPIGDAAALDEQEEVEGDDEEDEGVVGGDSGDSDTVRLIARRLRHHHSRFGTVHLLLALLRHFQSVAAAQPTTAAATPLSPTRLLYHHLLAGAPAGMDIGATLIALRDQYRMYLGEY
jgi:hypothetical protein